MPCLRTSLLFSFLLVYATSNATSVIAPADTACLEEHVYFNYNYKSKNYREAAGNWRKLIKECPTLYESLYLNGETLFKELIANESSEERKSQMIDTLLLIQDLRIKYYGKEGFVLGKKGVLLCKYRPKELGLAYDALEVSVSLEKSQSKLKVLNSYFKTVVKLGKAGMLHGHEVLSRFEMIMKIIEDKTGEISDESTHNKYQVLQRNLLIYGKLYLNCQQVVPWKESNFILYQDSILWLRRSLQTLTISGCEDAAIADKIAEQLHKLAPSSISAYNLCIKAIRMTKYEIAVTFLEEAVSLSASDSARIKYYFKLAEISRVQRKFNEARSYLRKILQLDPENARVYDLLGGYYNDFANLSGFGEFERGTIYWRSVDMYKKALSLKSSNANEIQEKIKSLEANFPKLSDLFFEKMDEGDVFQIEYWIKEKTKVRARPKD